jgi:hypothetical protein
MPAQTRQSGEPAPREGDQFCAPAEFFFTIMYKFLYMRNPEAASGDLPK